MTPPGRPNFSIGGGDEAVTPSETDKPGKLYYRIGEVSAMAGVPAYELRFWENEFPSVRPRRTDAGQRLYRQADIERILLIKHLLHEKRFTIQGARQYLKRAAGAPAADSLRAELANVRAELIAIRRLLER